ncbi:uncharacterized protein LOC111274373 [Durio zibethinus]|uniref:Uncharacterized protein LOC111274373 n=1 Tax=Durio zibethinus TaxID=66656 RepID=A0A6P5WFR8_DURZI|nr:uncharacterized protein LOC111274373 [Durio zibethinus]
MGHERSNNVDKIHPFYSQLQNSEAIGFQSLSNEAVCCAGISGVGTVDVPLNVLSNCPSFHMGDMSLVGIDWMAGASHLDSHQNFMVDPEFMNGINCMPSQYSTLENIDANTGDLQMEMQGAKMDDSKPQSIGNSMSCGSREHLLWGAQDGREMGCNYNLVDCVVQSNYPETLDGSFLTLGVGINTGARSKSKDSSRDFISKIDGAINTQLNPSHGQSGYGNSFSPDFQMAAGLSDFQTYAGGFSTIEENAVGLSSLKHNFRGLPSIVQNAGESSNVSSFAGSMQNVDDCTLSKYDIGVAGNTSSNFSLSPSQMLPTPQSHFPHPFLTPGDQKFGAGFANIDPNQGFHGLSGVSSNVEHIRRQSGLPSNQGFCSLSGTSLIVHSSSQSGLPVQEQCRMSAGLSDFQTYAGGFSSIEENAVGLSSLKHNFRGLPSIVQNAGESSNMSSFAGSMQNVDACTLSKYDLGVAGNTSSNFSLSPLQMLPIPQSHFPHPFLSPGYQKFGAGFANIDPNQGFHGLSGVSSNVEHIRRQSGLPPNQGFHSLSGTSPIVHGSRQSGLPVQEQHGMAPWTSLSSFMTSKYAAVASDQLQKCNMGSIPSLQWGTSVLSVLGNIESTSSQSDVWQHYPAHQDAAIQTVENAPFSKRIELQLADQLFACDRSASQVASSFPFSKNFALQTASKDKLCGSDGNAAEVVSIVPSSNNIGVQAATYLGQSPKNNPVQASDNHLAAAYTSGQVIPFAGGSGPVITSSLLARPSLKRKAAQLPPATAQVQTERTKSAKPSIHSSALNNAQNALSIASLPSAPVPTIAHLISSVPPVTVTPRPFPPLARKGPPPRSLSQATPCPPLVRTIPIPPSARMSPPPHIKWQGTEPLQLSGYNCLLCKRDLSYTPEGPVSQPLAPPPVAVLSCGHCFHDLCLQRITPKDQADNPPCIPCVIVKAWSDPLLTKAFVELLGLICTTFLYS